MTTVERPDRREILIAEDDSLNQLLLATYLEEQGYKVRVAGNGLEALKLVRLGMPDLVITDVNMPEMNGLELCRRLRSHHKMARIPIILLSGLSQPPEILAGYAEGADDYVVKPVDFAVLSAKVEALLIRRERQVAETGGQSGGVLLFLHAKGGAGATTVAVNLACMVEPLTLTGASVLDLSLSFGGAAQQLGLTPRLSLADLSLQPPELLDKAMFNKFISEGSSGPSLVRAVDRPEHGQLVTVPAVQSAISHLRERYQYVVVDAPPILNEHLLAALDVADLVFVVTGPARADLLLTGELLRLLGRLEVPPARQLLVLDLNRPDRVLPEDAAELLGRRVDLTIPYSERFAAAVDASYPLALSDPQGEEMATIGELAAGLGDRLVRAAAGASDRKPESRTG